MFKKTKDLLLKKCGKIKPQLAIITGSGVKVFPDNEPVFEISYTELPIYKKKPQATSHKPSANIIGHENKLKLYKIKNKAILVFSGRKHLYQGANIFEVSANVKLASMLGIKELIITNAAGGLNPKFKAGDLMLITGFIDLMQPTERGVLSAIMQPPKLIEAKLTKKIKVKLKSKIRNGIYAGVIGPTYETYSEVKLLQKLKASAVGMSTIPELIAAKSFGLDFAGISIISNVWNNKHKPSHKEVVRQVNMANEKLNDLISSVIV